MEIREIHENYLFYSTRAIDLLHDTGLDLAFYNEDSCDQNIESWVLGESFLFYVQVKITIFYNCD